MALRVHQSKKVGKHWATTFMFLVKIYLSFGAIKVHAQTYFTLGGYNQKMNKKNPQKEKIKILPLVMHSRKDKLKCIIKSTNTCTHTDLWPIFFFLFFYKHSKSFIFEAVGVERKEHHRGGSAALPLISISPHGLKMNKMGLKVTNQKYIHWQEWSQLVSLPVTRSQFC